MIRRTFPRIRSRRLATVWATSTLARATVLPVIVIASNLRDDLATTVLVTLAAVGFVSTLIAFAIDAAFGRSLGNMQKGYIATAALLGAVVTCVAAKQSPSFLPVLVLALAVQYPAVATRQRLLLDGHVLMPYGGVVVSNIVLALLLIVVRSASHAQVGAVLAFFAAELAEWSLYLIATPTGTGVPGVSAIKANRYTGTTIMMIGHTLTCLLPWLLRVVTAMSSGASGLRVVEFADKTCYLAVSGVLGGLATELQRRWASNAAAARRESARMAAGIVAFGALTGAVAAGAYRLVFLRPALSSALAVVLFGVAAGALGGLTVMQRLMVVEVQQAQLGRILTRAQASTGLAIIAGGSFFGLVGLASAYAIGLTVVVLWLVRLSAERSAEVGLSVSPTL